jgi:hypothetical protein
MHYFKNLARAAALTLLVSAYANISVAQQTPEPAASASAPAAPAVAGKGEVRIVKSRDGSYTGELIGTAAPNSKFAKAEIGMSLEEVQQLMGRAPDRSHTYESGKRWIPFYFGNDVRRMQALYKGEGCLIFTAGSAWGYGAGDLLSIEADPTGTCYQP